MKKKTYRLVILLMLAVLLTGVLSHVALADHGPKKNVHLKVINAPQEKFYIALLQRYNGTQEKENSLLQVYTPVFDARVEMYLKNFWYDSYYYYDDSTGRCTYKKSDEWNWYNFYFDSREGFRLIVIEDDGTVTLTEPIRGERYRSEFTYDFATGEISEEIPLKSTTAFTYLCCYILTVLIELVVLWVFRFPFKFVHDNTLAVLIVNVVTNIPFTAYVLNAKSSWLYGRIVLFEVGIMVFECLVYSFVLRNKEGKRDYKRSIAYGVVANVVSALSMFLPF